MSQGHAYEVSELDGVEAFAAIAGEWNALQGHSQSPLPFLRYEWLENWWRHFGAGRRLAILSVRREGRLVLGLPLLEEWGGRWGVPFVTLRSLTNDHSFQFDMLAAGEDPAAVRALWNYLRRRPRQWHLLRLEEVARDEAVVRSLVDEIRRDGFPTGLWNSYESPFLPLEGDWDAFQNELKAKFRSNLRNRTKRIRALGPVTHEMLDGDAVTDEVLQRCFEIERRGWKGTQGSAIACDSTLVSFYTGWCRIASRLGWLRVSVLRVGDSWAAFDISLRIADQLYCLKISYDPEYAPYSAGQLLNSEILSWCFAEGVKQYHFLGPLTEAKKDWQPCVRPHAWLFAYNRGPVAGAAHLYKFVLREGAKRLLQR